MGGCYRDYSASTRAEIEEERRQKEAISFRGSFKKFLESGDLTQLTSSYNSYTQANSGKSRGVFAQFAKLSGIENVENIPKEFDGIEYEVKFNVEPYGNGKEPSIVDYMDAFDFPATNNARYLKDPINTNAEGINNFYGDSDEKLVVIEKAGKIFLKEKGPVLPIKFDIPGKELVIKRTENRYASSFEEAVKKVEEVSRNGSVYKGKIRKEKGDFFVLDTCDGRIYSASFTRAHLIKPNETKESSVQRQLEMEYAGYLPKFPGFVKDSEEQIVKGMVNLGMFCLMLYHDVPIDKNWRAGLNITHERKFDFISGGLEQLTERNVMPLLLPKKTKNVIAK